MIKRGVKAFKIKLYHHLDLNVHESIGFIAELLYSVELFLPVKLATV